MNWLQVDVAEMPLQPCSAFKPLLAVPTGSVRELQVAPGDDNAKIMLSRTKADGAFHATSHKVRAEWGRDSDDRFSRHPVCCRVCEWVCVIV